MGNEKDYSRFNLKFNKTDPRHIMAVGILNRQGVRSKAQYIVNAVLHYENCGKSVDDSLQAQFNQKLIEIAMNRVLHGSPDDQSEKRVAGNDDRQDEMIPNFAEDIVFDEAFIELGEDGINAIAGALDMFRRG